MLGTLESDPQSSSGNILKRRLAGERVGIPPRQIHFSFPEKSPRYVYGGNATASMLLAVLSGVFPPGERFFVESVRHYRERITDETLKQQVSGFIGQESIHGREHERLNAFWSSRGIDTSIAERAINSGLRLLKRLPARQQLACTAMMEHFTAILAEQMLTDEEFYSRLDREMLPIWQWHALEELEHKSVTYDVYEMLGSSRVERMMAITLVVAALGPGIFLSWFRLVAREGKLADLNDMQRGLRLLMGPRGFLTRTLFRLPEFVGRNFHPARRDTSALEQRWRDILFGDQGQLAGDWRY